MFTVNNFMNNISVSLCVDYVYLDSSQRKKLDEESYVYISSIPANDCYRVYQNLIILFVEEKVGNIKYSSYTNHLIKKIT